MTARQTRTGLALLALGCLALALVASSVWAADKSPLRGCYIELSASGELLANDRDASAGGGAGCDAVLGGSLLLGLGARADFGDLTAADVTARLGLLVNPHLTVYGTASWRVKDWEIANNGAWSLGAGIETTIIADQVSAFVQGDHVVSKFGTDALALDDSRVTAGLRLRLSPSFWHHKPLM